MKAIMPAVTRRIAARSEEHTSELQSQSNLVCRLLLEKKKLSTSKAMWIIARDVVHNFADLSPAESVVGTGSFLLFCYDPATTEIYTLSLHDALPILSWW